MYLFVVCEEGGEDHLTNSGKDKGVANGSSVWFQQDFFLLKVSHTKNWGPNKFEENTYIVPS